jgi:hypothetical protein
MDALLRPSQAARYMACDATTVKVRMRSGHLRVVSEGEQDFVPSHEIDARQHIRPADPTDPHPLARISCALGAMADLIHDARRDDPPVLLSPGEIAGATQHVLSLAAVTARHTLTHSPLDDAVRPLLIARYAERVIDTLRDVALRPASLGRLASTAPEAQPRTLPDRLEATLHTWHQSTRTELARTIPSVDVLRQIANQGAHFCAVLELVEAHVQEVAAGEGALSRNRLRETRSALVAGDKAWNKLTTLTRPSHEFVTASRDLFTALRDTAAAVQRTDGTVSPHLVAAHLDHGLTRVADLMATTEPLPGQFMYAGILRAPATAIRATSDRLVERAHRHYVKVLPEDAPDLASQWASACVKAISLSGSLEGFLRKDAAAFKADMCHRGPEPLALGR